ncbi:unnamed protein product [Caenorhabditis sp. 36 PRJEB53466]|nr:unnamed protein product [Caenorhabditis sp. 36 PRJEB53466]
MVSPPLEVPTWAVAIAGIFVVVVIVTVFKDHLFSFDLDKAIKRQRESLIGPISCFPRTVNEDLENNESDYSFVVTPHCAYTIGNAKSWRIEPLEHDGIKTVLASDDANYQIPPGTRTVSYAFEGFRYGDHCLDFRPDYEPDSRSFCKYQMMCNRVQAVYFWEHGHMRLAGICIYLGFSHALVWKDEEELGLEREYNVFAFYDVIREKRKEEVEQRKKKEKEEEKRKRMAEEEPANEFTSSAHSHLRLCTEHDGRTVVLACNAEGKNEKYAFNEKEKRYEYVEMEEEGADEKTRMIRTKKQDNYLLRAL